MALRGFLTSVLVAGLIAAGCGSDGDSGDEPPEVTPPEAEQPLTKEELIAQGDELCAERREDVGALEAEYAELVDAGEFEQAADVLRQMADRTEETLVSFRELRLPPRDEELIGEYLDLGGRAIEDVRRAADALQAGELQRAVELAEGGGTADRGLGIAQAYGFEVCGSED